jgi:excisionase family DNA binding protein
MLNISECADVLRISVPTLRRMIYDKEVPYCKIGSQYRFTEDHIQKIIELNTITGRKVEGVKA